MVSGDGLALRGVEVRYGEIVAVSDVDLDVPAGSLVALLGTNGGGKSSLINAVSGLVPVATGRISWNGRPLNDVPAHLRARMGVIQVSQTKDLFPGLSVLDNLMLGALFEPRRDVVARRLADVLELFPQLKARKTHTAGALSGGEQQLVAFGRALMAAPKLLLMDEPTSGLAPIYVRAIADVLRVLKEFGVTQLLVEHNTQMALELADSFAVLRDGRLIYQGRPDELPPNREQFLGQMMLGG